MEKIDHFFVSIKRAVQAASFYVSEAFCKPGVETLSLFSRVFVDSHGRFGDDGDDFEPGASADAFGHHDPAILFDNSGHKVDPLYRSLTVAARNGRRSIALPSHDRQGVFSYAAFALTTAIGTTFGSIPIFAKTV